MKIGLLVFALLGSVACSFGPKREIASTGLSKPQVACIEKTTRKECFPGKDGKEVCQCVPDDSEMYQSYP